MLKNEYLLAKIGVDTAESEPRKGPKTYGLKDPVGTLSPDGLSFASGKSRAGHLRGTPFF